MVEVVLGEALSCEHLDCSRDGEEEEKGERRE